MRKTIIGAFILPAVLALAPTASAHPTSSFTACASHRRIGGACTASSTFVIGEKVHLRGSVHPPHGRLTALVLERRPSSRVWRRVGEAPISDTGRIRWDWQTTSQDGTRKPKPYGFRFKIPGHGKSDPAAVVVLNAG